MTKLAALVALLVWAAVAGASVPATSRQCTWGGGPTPNKSYAYGLPCTNANGRVDQAVSVGRHEGDGPWTLRGWRFWKTDGGVIGNVGSMWIDARIGCAPCAGTGLWTKKIGTVCNGRGFVEAYNVYRMSCAKGWTLIHGIPTNGAQTWKAHGLRWWSHPNYEVETIIGVGAAGYIYVIA